MCFLINRCFKRTGIPEPHGQRRQLFLFYLFTTVLTVIILTCAQTRPTINRQLFEWSLVRRGPHPEHHFVHGVQLRQVLLGVRVPVVEVDGSGGSMAGLSYHGSQRPGQLVDQVRPDDNILDQTSRWTGYGGRHVYHVPEVIREFVCLPVQAPDDTAYRSVAPILWSF